MTPIISTVLSAATQMIPPEASTEITSIGASSFENFLSSAMQSMDKKSSAAPAVSSAVAPALSSKASLAVAPIVNTKADVPSQLVANESTQTSAAKNTSITVQAPVTSKLGINDLLNALTQSSKEVPAIQKEVESLKQLITKDLSNQNIQSKELITKDLSNQNIQSKELITKEPLNKDLLTKSKSQPMTTVDLAAKNTNDPTLSNVINQLEIKSEKDLQSTDQNNVVNAQIMLASMLQQAVPQTANNPEVQPAKDEVLLSDKSLNSSLNKQSSDQMSSFNKEATIDIQTPSSKNVSVNHTDLNVNPGQIQSRLSEGKNQEITKQLSQLQAKYDLGNSGANRDNSSSFVSAITPNVVNQVSDSTSSENNFSFLAKDQSSTMTNWLENASLVNHSTNGMQFAEHLNQKNLEVSANQISTSSEQHIQTPFQSPDWGPALNQRVTWMIKDQMQNATITINPAHLGQIEIKLQTDQAQQTSVQFMSNNPEVRQAITDHLGTLREMMSQNGLQLGQADVGARNQSSSEQYGSSANKKGNRQNFSLPEITSTESSQGIGLINTYA
jgi:flagellar hook-length control protein FliK